MSSPVDLRVEYEAALARHGYRADDSQRQAVERLDDLGRRLRAAHSKPAGLLARLFGRDTAPDPAGSGERGIYLWGGVGRGKTFLMDLFHAHCGVPARREHFHRLMKDVHVRLRGLREVPDPLDRVATDIARSTRVLCIDELFVSDIADAMLLAGLFQGLLQRGVTLVFTSNLPPSELYRDGLQRQRFLPAIALIERHCEQVNVDAGEDYRLRLLARAPLYLDARGADVDRELAGRFEDLCGEPAARRRRGRDRGTADRLHRARRRGHLVLVRRRSARARARRRITWKSRGTTTRSSSATCRAWTTRRTTPPGASSHWSTSSTIAA